MNTPMRDHSPRFSWVHFAAVCLAATALGVIVFSTGCDNTAEGDRCNIALSHDECSGAPTAQCVVPTGCVVACCCSVDNSGNITSKAASCQPCPAGDDGGSAEASGGGPDGGGSAEASE
jgi:hypothetical protein